MAFFIHSAAEIGAFLDGCCRSIALPAVAVPGPSLATDTPPGQPHATLPASTLLGALEVLQAISTEMADKDPDVRSPFAAPPPAFGPAFPTSAFYSLLLTLTCSLHFGTLEHFPGLLSRPDVNAMHCAWMRFRLGMRSVL